MTGWQGGGETVPATPRPGDPATLAAGLRPLLADVGEFSRVLLPSHRLRGYQLAPARAVAGDIVAGGGGQFVWVFSRQSGKDESLAQLCAWLLTRYQRAGGTIIVAAPTADPGRDPAGSGHRSPPALRAHGRTSQDPRGLYRPDRPGGSALPQCGGVRESARADRLAAAGRQRGPGYRPRHLGRPLRSDGGEHQRHDPVHGHRLGS